MAVLEGTPGVGEVAEDPAPRTVRVRYDPERIQPAELIRLADHADLRLRAHHHLAMWFGAAGPWNRKKRTARILSDRAV